MEPSEIVAHARGAELCVQTFGDPADPAVLLIHGGAASMDWWEEDFIVPLVEGGYLVIRYDHRDTGRSTTSPPGQPDYTGQDLADDVLAVLDAVGVARAHLVGVSMGGALAQETALEHPERVLSLTLATTSPIGRLPEGTELPPMSGELAATFAGGQAEPSDRAAVVDGLVDSFRVLAGSRPFDEAGIRAVAERVADRSHDVASGNNHFMVGGDSEPSRTLGELDVPTLVIHGDEDPLFPLPHGEALARLIPGARLLVLDRVGHELPRSTWDVVVPALLDHLGSVTPAPAPPPDR